MAEQVRQYVAIDAKSFYASVECVRLMCGAPPESADHQSRCGR